VPEIPNISAAIVYFRVTRSGDTFTTYYNVDGSNTWIRTGSIDYSAPSTTPSVGMFVSNQWVDNPISVDFYYFHCGSSQGKITKIFLPALAISPIFMRINDLAYAGYAASGTQTNPIAYRDVMATWTIPGAVSCQDGENSKVATWIGFIDSTGYNTKATSLVQIGTEIDCEYTAAGEQEKYWAVWQIFKEGQTSGVQRIFPFPISPTDQIKVEVKSKGSGVFSIEIWNITRSSFPFSYWQKDLSGYNSPNATAVAACIQENPPPALFTNFHSITITCSAAKSGEDVNRPIGFAGSIIWKYVIDKPVKKALTGELTRFGDTFTVNWLHQ